MPTTPQNPIERKVERALEPFNQFIRHQATGSVVLLACTVAALVWANSPARDTYFGVLETQGSIAFGDWALQMSAREWISDVLMTLFFYLLGLEIKREFIAGQLKSLKRSVPVIMAALGGMVVPACLFAWITHGHGDFVHGWGIPMATDTAFAIGLLTLLGSRVPPGIIAFVTALAIIDDLGAILVIALFYTSDLKTDPLLIALALAGMLVTMNVLGVRRPLLYLAMGLPLWYFIHHSGVHATIAGILVAAASPARPKRDAHWFLSRLRQLTTRFERKDKETDADFMLADDERHDIAERMIETVQTATTPLQRWERGIEYPVFLLIMPVFALANAGIALDFAEFGVLLTSPLTVAIAAGLIIGKAVGIYGMTRLTVTLGWGELPEESNFAHVTGVGLLAGVGFTMSIFIAGLSFEPGSATYQAALTGILLSSFSAGAIGVTWILLKVPKRGR